MAVIIGDIHQVSESVTLHERPFTWLTQKVGKLFTSRRNPSPFPDRVWRRHSALLDAAWKRKLHANNRHHG